MSTKRRPQSHPQTKRAGTAEAVHAAVAPEDAPASGASAADSRGPRDDAGRRDWAAGCPDGAIPAHLLADGDGNAPGRHLPDGTTATIQQSIRSDDGGAAGDGGEQHGTADADAIPDAGTNQGPGPDLSGSQGGGHLHLADAEPTETADTPAAADRNVASVRDTGAQPAVPVGRLPRFAGRDIRDYIKIVYRGTDQPTDTDAEVR